MQETPPHTLLEIKLLLSQYLDGLLEPEQVQEAEGLLSRFPQYVEELGKLRKTREALKASLDNQNLDNPGDQSAWQTISERLKADQKFGVRGFDAEFVSAYYDGEIPASDSEFIEFESQLFHNAKANETLAQMGEVSEAVRQFGYRLETACTLDMTQTVMAAFLSEQGNQSMGTNENLEKPVPLELELLSAYADQALTPKETIAANRLIESDLQAKTTLTRFNQLSEGLYSVSSQIQAQAPDFWPSVSEILSKAPEEGGLVISIDRFRSLRRWAKIVGPIAASVLLAVFLMPARQQAIQPVAQSVPVTRTTSPEVATIPVALQKKSDQTELASVPTQELEQRGIGIAFAADRAELPAMTIPVKASRQADRPAARLVDTPLPSPKLASSRPVVPAVEAQAESRQPATSSEEYLFSALNEQMPGEDVSSMFGK